MTRRTILATAGAIALTVVAGTAAVAANVGLLGSTTDDTVGELSPVTAVADTSTTTTAPPEIETVIVDEPVPAGSSGSGAAAPTGTAPAATAPAPAPAPAPAASASPPPTIADDHSAFEDEAEHEAEPEDRFEGSEDDD